MKLTFLGAAGVVTGSAYLLQSDQATILIDFGMFQGDADLEAQNWSDPLAGVSGLDAVLLTHAHLDHSGRLPLLARRYAYHGPIYGTQATVDMAAIILRDSARINAGDVARENRKRERAGEEPLQPLYEPQDAEAVLSLMRPVPYDQPIPVAPGITATMLEAGHMLGSASIYLAVEDGGRRKVLLFSGDLGPHNLPIMRTAEPMAGADLVIMESTYGDRDHPPLAETLAEGREIVLEAAGRQGKILVPAFAVGRTQQLMYHMVQLFATGDVDPFPIYIDSPMAIQATDVYRNNTDLFDEEAAQMRDSGQLALGMEYMMPTPSVEDSRAINNAPTPCMVIATSGMCTGGRILHHLRHNLWRPETTVILVGYQAVGTLGRQLVDGAETVQIFGDTIRVNAAIHNLGGLSAHAGQTDLLKWFAEIAGSRPRLVLTHGESRQRETLASLIKERHGLDAALPWLGDTIEV